MSHSDSFRKLLLEALESNKYGAVTWCVEIYEELQRYKENAEESFYNKFEPMQSGPFTGYKVDVYRGLMGTAIVSCVELQRLLSDRSQREAYLADECGRLRNELENVSRDRDKSQAELYRLTGKK